MIFDDLREYGVIPVVAVDSVDDGLKLAEALSKGGLPVAEITFRTTAAEAVIREVCKRFPEMKLGAGTVLTPDQVKRAKDAGAQFAVAPGCNPTIVKAALAEGLVFAPGICTPSDIECAVELGCRFLKFFPAGAAGGPKMLSSIAAPYRHLGIKYCPTGGVTSGNMKEYLELEDVSFVGGTWLAKKTMIANGEWDKITKLAKDAVATAAAV